MGIAFQTVYLENDCAIDLQSRVTMEKPDFVGHVPYPVFDDIDFAEKHVQLFGVKVSLKGMPKELSYAILEWACEAIDDAAWED